MRIGMVPSSGGATTSSAVQVDVSGEISGLTAKSALAANDVFLIEDSAASNAKKKVVWSTVFAKTKWALLTLASDQTGLVADNLVSGIDTVTTGSTGHGVTVSAGVITLPANTAGHIWRLRANLHATNGSTTSSPVFAWTENPSGSPPTEVGRRGFSALATSAANAMGYGTAGQALHYFTGTGTVGVMVVVLSTGTVNVAALYTKIEIDEVPA